MEDNTNPWTSKTVSVALADTQPGDVIYLYDKDGSMVAFKIHLAQHSTAGTHTFVPASNTAMYSVADDRRSRWQFAGARRKATK